MSKWSFSEENLIRDGVVVGKFDGGIAEILPHKGGVVIRTYANEGEGVYLINPDGSIKWRIDSSEHNFNAKTLFTSIFFINDELIAFEASGHDCYVDIETGKVTKIEFMK